MNNYFLSFIFLIFVILYYVLVGSFALAKINIEKNKFAVYVIVGWMITFSLGWITGFPAQLNSKSWFHFANVFGIALIVMGVGALIGNLFFNKVVIASFCSNVKKHPNILIKYIYEHFKKYWLIYLFVFIFTWLSITNMQPYTLNNYSDDHYIIKMVHNFKANKLLTEDLTGNILHSYQKFGYARQYGHRMFNTYEIVYTYFANLFGIDVVAFARFAMTIHNYLIWFYTFQILGSIYLDENKSQFSILFLAILLIPEGFAARGMEFFKIRIFENWRNQTAIYMGSAIVRNLSFPLFIYYTSLFLHKKSIRTFLIFPLVAITLISFQTTAVSYLILFLPIFLLALVLHIMSIKFCFSRKDVNKSLSFLTVIALFLIIILILITSSDNLLEKINGFKTIGIFNDETSLFSLSNGITLKKLNNLYSRYLPFYNNVFKLDTFAKIAPVVLILNLFLTKDKTSKISTIEIIFIYLIFKLNRNGLTLSLISFEFYGTARMLNSMILLVIFMSGVTLVLLIDQLMLISKLSKRLEYVLISVLCLSTSLGTFSFINLNSKKISNYNRVGDGIVRAGYSMIPLTSNDKMIPQFLVDIAYYFNGVPSKKIIVYTHGSFKYNGLNYSPGGLLLASNKIASASASKSIYELAVKNKDKKTALRSFRQFEANFYLSEFLDGKTPYRACKDRIDKSDINYAVFTEKKYVQSLIKNNWKIVYGSDKKKFWILKKN